jgi:hypothetical protein
MKNRNTTARLIQWQRLTIGALLAALLVTALAASRSQSVVRYYQRSEALWLRSPNTREDQRQWDLDLTADRAVAEVQAQRLQNLVTIRDLEEKRASDQRIIRDLNRRIGEYEARYGISMPAQAR